MTIRSEFFGSFRSPIQCSSHKVGASAPAKGYPIVGDEAATYFRVRLAAWKTGYSLNRRGNRVIT